MISNTLRLLALPKEIQDSIMSRQITEGHAKALLGIEDERVRLDVWRKIVSDELTVRQAEEIAKALRAGNAPLIGRRPSVEEGDGAAGGPARAGDRGRSAARAGGAGDGAGGGARGVDHDPVSQ